MNIKRHQYISGMADRGRIIIIHDGNGNVAAVVGYCLTDNPSDIPRDDIWSLPPDNPDGHYIYVDRLIKNKESDIRKGYRDLIDFLRAHHPKKKLIWHSRRNGNEIHVTYT